MTVPFVINVHQLPPPPPLHLVVLQIANVQISLIAEGIVYQIRTVVNVRVVVVVVRKIVGAVRLL